MKQVLSHSASGHSKSSNLAPSTTNKTSLSEHDHAGVDSETIKAKSLIATTLVPTPAYRDISAYTKSPRKVSLWSRLYEPTMAGKKGQLNTIYENMGLPEVEIQRDLLPWSGKTLILGSSESGKSTLLKSLKLYMKGSYTLDERAAFKEIIFSNAVQSMRIVLEAMEALRMPLEHGQSEYRVQALDMLPAQVEMQQILDLVANAIEALYADLGGRGCLKLASEYQVDDSAE